MANAKQTRSKGRQKRSETKTLKASKPAAAPEGPAGASGGELVGIEEAVAILRTTRPTFYRWLRAGRVKAMKAGRQWRFYRRDLERFLHGEAPRIEVPGDIAGLLVALDAQLLAAGVEPPRAAEATPATIIQRVLQLADKLRASDIHFEPPVGESSGSLRFRIDGVLVPAPAIDPRVYPALVDQLKMMAACDLQQKKRPQDGRILLTVSNDKMDLRVCFVPAIGGEAATIRLLRRGGMTFRLDELPYSPVDLERIGAAIKLPWGIMVFTGPAGSGKTTSMYSALNAIDPAHQKIVTIEDPVEYAFPGMLQLPVHVPNGNTYAALLRSVLRSDPDVIMVGEIREGETLQICVQAALTGHLVLTTLHTNDAPSALTRMRDLGLDPFLIGDGVKLIVAQRLARKLCPECSQPVELTETERQEAAQIAAEGGLKFETLPSQFRRNVGCGACGQTGYRGRTLLAETLAMSPAVAAALRAGATAGELRRTAVEQGMTTMAADGVRRAAAGVTSLTEALRTAPRQ